MTSPIEELKIRARLLLKGLKNTEPSALQRARQVAARQRWPQQDVWQLSFCLNIVSAESGFEHWNHARSVLNGEAASGEDMGRLWYDARCSAFLNQWFSTYAEAKAVLTQTPKAYLLPYGRQYLVVDEGFIETLGLSADDPAWTAIQGDLVSAYGSAGWQRLTLDRLRQLRPA